MPKLTVRDVKRAAGREGADSVLHNAAKLTHEIRLDTDVVAAVLGFDPDAVYNTLSGKDGVMLDDTQRTILGNCLATIIPIGIERRLLPCSDTKVIPEILRTTIEILHLKNNAS